MSLSAKGSRLFTGIVVLGIILIVLPGCFGGGGGTQTTYTVSGRVTQAGNPQQGIPDVTLTFNGGFGTATTDSNGNWSKNGLRGTVTIAPAKDGWAFQPPSRQVSSAATDVDFTGTVVNRQLLVPAQYPTVQAAIDAAQDGDVVIVSQGTYRENLDFKGKAITVRSTNPNDPAVVASTVIDAGQNGSVVTFHSGETADAVLMGFTITNGWGRSTDGDSSQRGGGITIRYSSPQIRCNTISGNKSTYRGGGIYVFGGSPLIAGNTIRNNRADNYGGGIYAESSTLSVTGNTIEGNEVAGVGGGLYVDSCRPVIVDNVIRVNRAASDGGGLYLCGSADSAGEVRNNSITGNTAAGFGGGVYALGVGAGLVLTGNNVDQNTAQKGGGIFASHSRGVAISGNVISRNSSTTGGGGISTRESEALTISGNTIRENVAFYNGGGLNIADGSLAAITVTDNRIELNEATAPFPPGKGGGVYVGPECAPKIVGNQFTGNRAVGNGGAIYVHATGQVLDDQGSPLPRPDTHNTYTGNSPDDIYYE